MVRPSQDKVIFTLNKARLFQPAAPTPGAHHLADTDNAAEAGCSPTETQKALAHVNKWRSLYLQDKAGTNLRWKT